MLLSSHIDDQDWDTYLAKHRFIWYRLCLNASGIVSTAEAEAIMVASWRLCVWFLDKNVGLFI